MQLKELGNVVALQTVAINHLVHSLAFDHSDDGADHEKLLNMLNQHGKALEAFVAEIAKLEEALWSQ